MAFQSYISIDWDVSPRIVTVADTETEVSIQDLYDTLRTLEAVTSGVDNNAIVSGAGKEILGPGVAVGLTITLLNAKVAFEARPPSTFIQCAVRGGNLTALDANGSGMPAIYPTAYTQVVVELSSSATSIETLAAVTDQDKTDIIDGVTGSSVVAAIKAKTDNLPYAIAKARALDCFPFAMISSTDHVTPREGRTVSAQVSKDGGAYVDLTSPVSEIGYGAYKIALTAEETDATAVLLRFTAAGADVQLITVLTNA